MGRALTSDPAHFAQLDKAQFMGEIRYIIIAKQCEVAGTSSILDGLSKKILRPPKTIFLTPISY